MKTSTQRPLMIIDDDDDIRMALVMIMTAHGYEIAAHGNARAALTALRDGCRPFLILLDLMMAGMTGWEFRAVQMGDPALAIFPVVVLTAVSSARDGSPGLDGGDTPQPLTPMNRPPAFAAPRSVESQGLQRIDSSGAARRNPRCQERHTNHHKGDDGRDRPDTRGEWPAFQ